MYGTMCFWKVIGRMKTFPHCVFTFIGFSPYVSSFVPSKGFLIWKDFSTLITFIGFLSSVTPFMCSEVTGRNECLPTLFTFIYLLRTLLRLSWFIFNVTFLVPSKGWMMHLGFSICSVIQWFQISVFLQIAYWNKVEVFSAWTNVFSFRETLYHSTSVNHEKNIINILIILYLLYLLWFTKIVSFSMFCELLQVEYTKCSTMEPQPFY